MCIVILDSRSTKITIKTLDGSEESLNGNHKKLDKSTFKRNTKEQSKSYQKQDFFWDFFQYDKTGRCSQICHKFKNGSWNNDVILISCLIHAECWTPRRYRESGIESNLAKCKSTCVQSEWCRATTNEGSSQGGGQQPVHGSSIEWYRCIEGICQSVAERNHWRQHESTVKGGSS